MPRAKRRKDPPACIECIAKPGSLSAPGATMENALSVAQIPETVNSLVSALIVIVHPMPVLGQALDGGTDAADQFLCRLVCALRVTGKLLPPDDLGH